MNRYPVAFGLRQSSGHSCRFGDWGGASDVGGLGAIRKLMAVNGDFCVNE
jgi:hypothetical protein